MTKTRVSRLGMVLLSSGILALAACGGGGGSSGGGSGTVPIPNPSASAPPPSATPTPPGASSATIQTSEGATNGETGQFTPSEGDTASGGQGQPVDGVTCDTTMSDNYHVHVYLGVFVNGTQVALPPGTGMFNPQPPQNGFVNLATCFYHLHTHDASGIVHIEDPDPQNLPITQSMYTLKTYLDEWGITTDANHFGPFQGPVRIFTSGSQDRSGSANDTVDASTLSYYGSDASTIPLYSHEVIFVQVGPTFGPLPNVHFYINQ